MLKEKLTELRTLQKLIYKDEKKVADAAVISYDVYIHRVRLPDKATTFTTDVNLKAIKL